MVGQKIVDEDGNDKSEWKKMEYVSDLSRVERQQYLVIQLLNELETKSWIISEDEKLDEKTFKNSVYLWKDKLIELGGEYLIWSNSPENPQHN